MAASGIGARLHRCGLADLDEELRQQQAAQEAWSRDCTATAFASNNPGQSSKDGTSQAEAAQRREELERQKEELRRMEEARWGKLWVVWSVGDGPPPVVRHVDMLSILSSWRGSQQSSYPTSY